MCGAAYAKVESAMARGENIPGPGPEAIAARIERQRAAAEEKPGRLVSVLVAIGFTLILFALLAGLALFGVTLGAPPDGPFVRSMVAGWAVASALSLALSMRRQPLAGILAGMACGALAALVTGIVSAT